MSPRLDTYSRGGLTFDVTDTGPEDGRVVIALHGFPEDRHCWDAVGSALAGAGHRMLAPDQRGYSPGARPSERKAYAISELDSDILALADAAGADRFDVVGHDWGGAVAWDLAGRHPDRVRTATVLSTPHPRAFQASLLRSSQLLHSWYMLFFQIPRIPEAAFRARGGRQMEASLLRSGLDPQSAARYAARFSQPGAMTGPINWYRALAFGASTPTPVVQVPTLYVWSDNDRFLSRKAAELTARYVTGSYRFEVLAGENHWLPSGAPDKVSRVLLEHLADHPN
ncbi:MAG TPA: alpha/beta fold hydrolase [Acidimicrobiales bacterium]|nr:alpha/beta fold hydrolase [Acidimicrobiales bacterium]